MTRSDDLYSLPPNLPVPIDDGACDQLPGVAVPSIELRATNGTLVNLATLRGRVVVFIYPRTGRPEIDPPPGWGQTAGLRGCTPQACGFRDTFSRFQELGVQVFGLSSQATEYQQEMVERLHLPFPVLSDVQLQFASALHLPTLTIDGVTVIKRITLAIEGAIIRKVVYPVFPPDKNAEHLLQWLRANPET